MAHSLGGSAHPQAIGEMVSLVTRYRELTWALTKRDLSERYAGQWLRTFWVIAHPLVIMAVYVLVFTVVFGSRWEGGQALPGNYAIYILAGLIPWMAFQESLQKSCQAITAQASLVKQVIFPIEVLPVKGVLASLVTQVIGMGGLAVFGLLSQGSLSLTYALLPVLLMLQLFAMIGMGYVLSSVAVYFRDLKDLVRVFCMIGVYLMPVLYLPHWVPRAFEPLLYLNPFSYMVWCYQDVLYFGRFDHPLAWITFSGLSIGVFFVGYFVFRHLKTGFGNVL